MGHCLMLISTSGKLRLVLVTAPDRKLARKLAAAALQARLAACANIIPQIESHYWWKGKVETSKEVLILFKTGRSQLRKLEQLILELHPYDTPEFVALKPDSGNGRYLRWCESAVR